ncbi:hypothetical protein [Hyphomonas sp.]|uniref:hypothetical protein n=1 Tax=Hyphomonas sp. TaxID=87 RepID=UPI0025BEC03F|nr:hypothetical protein [Hyphomonas sp.]
MYRSLTLKPLLMPSPSSAGRSKAELAGPRLEILAAFDTLLAAFEASMSADCDYDPPSPVNGDRAREAWRERMEIVQGIRSEIEIETMTIAIS